MLRVASAPFITTCSQQARKRPVRGVVGENAMHIEFTEPSSKLGGGGGRGGWHYSGASGNTEMKRKWPFRRTPKQHQNRSLRLPEYVFSRCTDGESGLDCRLKKPSTRFLLLLPGSKLLPVPPAKIFRVSKPHERSRSSGTSFLATKEISLTKSHKSATTFCPHFLLRKHPSGILLPSSITQPSAQSLSRNPKRLLF